LEDVSPLSGSDPSQNATRQAPAQVQQHRSDCSEVVGNRFCNKIVSILLCVYIHVHAYIHKYVSLKLFLLNV